MAKTSIFSRDYERKKRKRKRRITLIIVLLVLIGGGIFIKLNFSKIDFGEIKEKLQAWVDSDNPKVQKEKEEEEKEKEKEIEEQKKLEEQKKKEEEEEKQKYMELKLNDGSIIKAELELVYGNKKFKNIENSKQLEYDISENRTQIVIIDKKQNMKLFNVEGVSKDITKTQYISRNGSVLTKEEALQYNPEYMWHASPRFINENKVAYLSFLPYYGSNLVNKYIWIYDLTNQTEMTIWSYAGADVALGKVDKEKGLQFNAYGNNYYLDANGNVTQ
ncbi:MAG: hypothetical protein SOZ71_03025 [Clostridium sp.]|nr:hypothetical protein [Clostridium sp.]